LDISQELADKTGFSITKKKKPTICYNHRAVFGAKNKKIRGRPDRPHHVRLPANHDFIIGIHKLWFMGLLLPNPLQFPKEIVRPIGVDSLFSTCVQAVYFDIRKL
jgi:hypothetical protein